jgi:hypothetical protein
MSCGPRHYAVKEDRSEYRALAAIRGSVARFRFRRIPAGSL